MDIKTIAVHYERKFNLGDYNSATVGVNLWADLDIEEDDVDKCLDELWTLAKENVKTQAQPLVGAPKENITQPKITPPPADAWEATADPVWQETQAHAEAKAQAPPDAVPVMGKDWG